MPVPIDPFLWIMLRPEWAGDEDDPNTLIAFANRVSQYGYNGFMLYDWRLSRPSIDSTAQKCYDTLSSWAAGSGWHFCLQAFPQGRFLLDSGWPGADASMYAKRHLGDEWYIKLLDPRVHDIYRKIAANVASVFPEGSPLVALMPAYDEFRVVEEKAPGKTSGDLLADHMRTTLDIIREALPWVLPALWSDMANPFENSKPNYYNAGDMTRAQDAITGGELIINWSAKAESFPYFAAKGCQQVVGGYFDWPGGNGGDCMSPADELTFCKSVAQYACGYQFTSWEKAPAGDWSHLKEYAMGKGRVPWQAPKLAGIVTPTPPPPPPPPNDDQAARLAAAVARAERAEGLNAARDAWVAKYPR